MERRNRAWGTRCPTGGGAGAGAAAAREAVRCACSERERERANALQSTMMRDTGTSSPLWPLNVETKWVPANSLPKWPQGTDGGRDSDRDRARARQAERSPPSSPVHSPPAALRLPRPASLCSGGEGRSGVRTLRQRLFDTIPLSVDRPQWNAHDSAEQPQLLRRRRQAAARERRRKRTEKSPAHSVVGAAAAGDLAELRQWMAIDDSYCNGEVVLSHATHRTSPLLEAAKNGHVSCCQLLLQRGARVDDFSAAPTRWTALMEAAAAGHVGVVNALCSFGANPLLESKQTGSTALSLAAIQGHAGAVAGLLALGSVLPRAVAAAASCLGEVAAALTALQPLRKIAVEKERELWVQGRQCERVRKARERSRQALEKRTANRDSRNESAKLTRCGVMWQNSGSQQLRQDFFAWRAQAAVHAAEKARARDIEVQERCNRACGEQSLALAAAAAARQDMSEAVERLQGLVGTAIQLVELAQSRAAVVGRMYAHTDVDGRSAVCHGKDNIISHYCHSVAILCLCVSLCLSWFCNLQP